MMIRSQEHSEKGVIDGRTDGRVDGRMDGRTEVFLELLGYRTNLKIGIVIFW